MSESQTASSHEDLAGTNYPEQISLNDWPTVLTTYEEAAESGWDSLINPDWQEPTRNDEIKEGVVSLPDGSKTVATRTWATVFRNQERAFRVVNWEKLTEKSDQEYARNDVRYKVLVARTDSTNLTPSIFAYDPETCSIEMEYVEGISLSNLKAEIKNPPRRNTEVLRKT
ncbi:hypothetical protein KC921_04330 [Candidatus Woesebacteria bacterium]|nr:hypothetical protein [Candidatus Woesebacteria bacterium]